MRRIRNHLLLFLCDFVTLAESIVILATFSFYRPNWTFNALVWLNEFDPYNEQEEIELLGCTIGRRSPTLTEVSELSGSMPAWDWDTEDVENYDY